MPRSFATIGPKSSHGSRTRRSPWASATSRRGRWSAPRTTQMSRSLPRVRASWLGSVSYRQAWDLQAGLVRELREGGDEDSLLLLEHPHVFTMGKAGAPEHVLWDDAERTRRQVEGVGSDRGGAAAHPRPGQLGRY